MGLQIGKAANPQARAFMAHYRARSIAPLYPEIVRAKIQLHISGEQFADEVRRKYAKRASRLRAAFQPPDLSRTYVLELDRPADFAATLAALKADPGVEYAEEDGKVSTNLTPNDPYFSSYGSWGQAYYDLWGLHTISASTAWDTSTGSGVVVAVVDTGIDYNHPDIAANVWTNPNPGSSGHANDVRGWNFVSNTNDPMDDNGHGTHVAGTIAAVGNNGIGVIGVAWNAQVMAVKGLDATGNGWDSNLGPALEYAVNNGADVISNSWSGQGTSQTTADAVDYAYNLGAVIVAAAGNNNSDASRYSPGNLWDVITVAATDTVGNKASFSNWGEKIDVAAPGVDILSLQASESTIGTVVTPGYMRLSGTSMATPHVSGLAGLILSGNPTYSNEDVRQTIRSSALPLGTDASAGFDSNFGYGLIDCAKAMTVTGVLEVRISSPAIVSTASAPVTISGVASGSELASWVLDYGSGYYPTSWTVLNTGATPASGMLGTFDASSLPNGTYTVRVTAYNGTGGAFSDRVLVNVVTTAITNPLPAYAPSAANTYKPGVVIPITGSMLVPGFQSYNVDWAPGVNPSGGWQTTGITLTGQGLLPVSNGTLAQWDTSSITQANYYTIRLTEIGTYFSNVVLTSVYLEPDLLSLNWPMWFDQGPSVRSGVVPVTNADGSSRLVMASPGGGGPGTLWSFDLSGAPQATTLPWIGSYSQPAVANIKGTGGDQVVVEDFTAVRVFQEDGSFDTFEPTTSPYPDFQDVPITIADLDGDSRLETLAFGENLNGQGYLFAWLPGGSMLNGNFPISISDQGEYSPTGQRFLAEDMNGDGRKELAVLERPSANTWTLGLFASDGTAETWNVPTLQGQPNALVGADLDNNGRLETIVASYSGTQAELDVFQPDGSERPGWPVYSPNNGSLASFLAVGDLKRDGHKEIVWSVGTELHLLTDGGLEHSSAWPLQTPASQPGYLASTFGSLVIGDIDGDGFPEIITTRTDEFPWTSSPYFYYDQHLLALRLDGTIARSWQLTGMNGDGLWQEWAPIIGDFNQDGLTEIAAAGTVTPPPTAGIGLGYVTLPGVVTMLNTGAPYNAVVNDWPMIYHDARNSSVLSGSSVCTYTVAPWPLSLNGGAASGSFQVHASATSCQWSAVSDSAWLTLTAAFSSGAGGSGTVNYSAAANRTSAARTAHVTIGSQIFFVAQPVDTLPQYTLTVQVQPSGAGIAGPGGSYDAGTQVCLIATPNPGWQFTSWSGTPLDSSNCLTLNGSASVTANFTARAQPQNSRSFVSTLGRDTNTCAVTAPCRTLTAALAVTAPGGEIVVLTSGAYEPATITQPVTISAVGIAASITAASGNALNINTTGNVTITGLSLHGQGSGFDGVQVQQVGNLRLYRITAEDFTDAGVAFTAGGNVAIYDSRFTDNNYGLLAGAARGFIHNTSFDHNTTAGVSGNVVVADSSAHYNGAGFESAGNTLLLAGDQAISNSVGISAVTAGAMMQFSSCSIVQNSLYAYSVASSAAVSGTSPGASAMTGGTNGSLSTASSLR